MSRTLLFLDTGIIGIITNPKSSSADAQNCKQWFKQSLDNGLTFILPEIADYEVRRELLRANKSQGIQRLDELKNIASYLPINTEVMLLASQMWADARKSGKPTADNKSLDADVILAAQAKLEELKGNFVIVVTTNKKHLSVFIEAREWHEIAPLS